MDLPRLRPLLPAAFLLVGSTLPMASAADDEPPTLNLRVGQSQVLGGQGGLCDDLKVATITQDTNATVSGVGPGTTLCSSRLGGPGGGVRKVYKVVVQKK
jgi:hypothetical protein